MRSFLIITLLILPIACASNSTKLDSSAEIRENIAIALEKDKNYYAALTQWKILLLIHPNNENIKKQKSRLEKVINAKIVTLTTSVKASASNGKKEHLKKLSLKILALTPDNQFALKILRQLEQSNAYKAATNKTASIKKYFSENQAKAQHSIQTSQFTTLAKQLFIEGKKNALLIITDKILLKYPNLKEAQKYKYDILVSFGKEKLESKNKIQALDYYKQALSMNMDNNKVLILQTNLLKTQLSNDYYRKAMDLLKIDINKAIELLEKSLSFNAENTKAAQQLIRVRRIQKKLQQISNMSKN